MALQFLIILVPVIFGLMGFALDLGRLYLIRGELHQAANAMALAAAAQMNGATTAFDNMTNAANQALNETNGNRYNFGSTVIPAGTITCFSTLTDASTNNQGATTDCGSAAPVFVQASISVPAPLLFWSLLPGGETRTTTVASYAVASVSAPLCTGCGIVPFAVQAPDSTLTDQVDWGFVPGNFYTFLYSCTGNLPSSIAGVLVPYVIVNRVDPAGDESDQMFRQGAQGLTGSTVVTTNPNACTSAPTTPISCVNVGDVEQLPISGNATPAACSNVTAQPDVTNALCGIYMRMDSNPPSLCQTGVADYGTLSPAYLPDTDLTYVTDPTAYVGNGRRIITVAIVSGLASDPTSCATTMTVVGFRQFLVEPNSDGSPFNPIDANGRFVGLYLGTVAPVSQGWFDTRYASSCRTYLTVGPGKVVLHQ
jgi:Flp pilus assembly protein TadG